MTTRSYPLVRHYFPGTRSGRSNLCNQFRSLGSLILPYATWIYQGTSACDVRLCAPLLRVGVVVGLFRSEMDYSSRCTHVQGSVSICRGFTSRQKRQVPLRCSSAQDLPLVAPYGKWKEEMPFRLDCLVIFTEIRPTALMLRKYTVSGVTAVRSCAKWSPNIPQC